MSEGKDTSKGEERAGGRGLRFRRHTSLFDKAVLSAPPAVPLFLLRARRSRQLTQLFRSDSPSFPFLPVLLSISSPWWLGKNRLHSKQAYLALESGNSDLKACRIPFSTLAAIPSFTPLLSPFLPMDLIKAASKWSRFQSRGSGHPRSTLIPFPENQTVSYPAS